MTPKVHVINGPNLNLLGQREPHLYGDRTLGEIDISLQHLGSVHGVEVTCFQSNSEGDLIDDIQRAKEREVDFLIVNPAAYTHTSVALRDALLATDLPFLEVHITNPCSREDFRKHSFFSDIASGSITGIGTRCYEVALSYAIDLLKGQKSGSF